MPCSKESIQQEIDRAKSECPDTMTVDEAAKVLGASKDMFWKLRNDCGITPAFRTAHVALYSREDVKTIYNAWNIRCARLQRARLRKQAEQEALRNAPYARIAHCGEWHALSGLSFVCPICQAQVF